LHEAGHDDPLTKPLQPLLVPLPIAGAAATQGLATQIGAAVKEPDGWHVAVVGPEMLYPAPHENVTTSPVTPVVLLTAPLSGAAVGEHARAVHDSAVPLSTHAPLALQAYDVDAPEYPALHAATHTVPASACASPPLPVHDVTAARVVSPTMLDGHCTDGRAYVHWSVLCEYTNPLAWHCSVRLMATAPACAVAWIPWIYSGSTHWHVGDAPIFPASSDASELDAADAVAMALTTVCT